MAASDADPRPDRSDVLERAAAPPDMTVAYGELADQVADLWWPVPLPPWADPAPGGGPGTSARTPEVALVVVVHGGFWREAYDRRHVAPLCADLAQRGFAVAAAEYRRVGGAGGWPATLDDAATVADRLPSVVAAAAMPTGLRLQARHVLVGHSAGGHLVLWAAGRHHLADASPWRRRTPDRSLAGVVALAPVAALQEAARDGVGDGAAEALVGAGPDELASRWEQADPARLVPTATRTVLLHGVDDDVVPVALSHAYADAAREAGEPPDVRALRGVGHYELIDPLAEPYEEVVEALRALLAADIDDS